MRRLRGGGYRSARAGWKSVEPCRRALADSTLVSSGTGQASDMVPDSSPARPALRDFWTELPREGKWLLSTIVIDFVGAGLVLPFLVVYLHEVRALPLDRVGLLVSIPAIVGLLILGPTGHLVDRVGARRIIVVAIVCMIAGNLLLAMARDEILAGVALVLEGIGGGVMWPAVQSFVSAVMPSRIRQRYFGMSFSLLNLGIGIGGILGGTLVDVTRPQTFVTLYLVNAATFLAPLAVYLGPLRRSGAPVSATPVDGSSTARPPTASTSYAALLREPPVLALFALTVVSASVGYAQLNAGAVAFARLLGGVSTQAIGYGFTVNTVVIVALQLFVLQRIEGRRRTRVMLGMAAAWAVSWAFLGLTALVPGGLTSAVLFAACMGIFGFGETLLQPTIPAMTNDLAPDALRGRYNALMAMGFQGAAIAAPVIATWLLDRGWGAAYIASLLGGCALVVALAFVVERLVSPRVNGLIGPTDPASP
jgi:MFS family permease